MTISPAGDYDPSDPTEARNNDPLNAYRYTGKRLDTGAGDGLDMGARRYRPDTARFLQLDYFNGALTDLALSADPLTSNRYGLAGGNPLSFIEWDGHMAILEGGGGSAPIPKPENGISKLTMVQALGLGLGAALDAGEGAATTGADNLLRQAQRWAAGIRSLAGRDAASWWWRLPGLKQARAFGLNVRAGGVEIAGVLNSAPVRLLGKALGAAGLVLGFAVGYGDQKAKDVARTDLSESDANLRAAFRGVTEAGFSVLGAGLAASACAPSVVLAAVCGAAGGFAGNLVGGVVADVGIGIVDTIGQIDWSDIKLPEINLGGLFGG